MYCFECINWNPDDEQANYCDHPQSPEFASYVQSCAEAGVFLDASDCPGYENVDEIGEVNTRL